MTCSQDFPNTAGLYSKIFKKQFTDMSNSVLGEGWMLVVWVSLTNVSDGKALTGKAVRRYSMIFFGKKTIFTYLEREKKRDTLCTLVQTRGFRGCRGFIFLLSKVAAAVFAQRQRQS